jgi:methylenetetrahydrofolate reductase (NADPH)
MELLHHGFRPIPHLSARMVRDQAHTLELAEWLRSNGLRKVFLVVGDAEQPGAYADAVSFLDHLLQADHGQETVGLTAYPDGHTFISDQALVDALFHKQQLLVAAGVQGYCTTQMCFDADSIAQWIRSQREYGLTLPIHLGIPGGVDKARLMKMGVRLGIGQSLGFLKKNRTAVIKMMTSTSYDLNDLLLPLSEDMLNLGVEGLHVFTFNQVEATDAWRRQELSQPAVAL